MKRLSVDGAAPQIDDDQVVPDELIGRLYRATENCVAALLPDMSVEDRAYLAMFCYRKSHLHSIGLAIAATCDEAVLVQAWGAALGQTLYAQSRERPRKPQPAPSHHRAKITLASIDDEEAEDVLADQSVAISIRLN